MRVITQLLQKITQTTEVQITGTQPRPLTTYFNFQTALFQILNLCHYPQKILGI